MHRRTVQCYLPDLTNTQSHLSQICPFTNLHPQNIPSSRKLSSEASPASCLQMAYLTSGSHTKEQKMVSAWMVPCCINDSKKLLKRAILIKVSSDTVGIWENLAGRQSGENVEARAQQPRKLSAKAKSPGSGVKKLGADPRLLWWNCELRPFMLP